MKIRLGTRKESMEAKANALSEAHRWYAWHPVKIKITIRDSSGYGTSYRRELHWFVNVERCHRGERCLWFFPKLWIFLYNYEEFNSDDPADDPIPDQFGKFTTRQINKILRNYIYDRKLRDQTPAVKNAYEHYQTVAGLSFDDILRKQD